MSAAPRICPVCDRVFPGAAVSYCPDDGAPLIVNSGDAAFEGRVIGGRFVIEKLLGKGGMGSVFLARQRAIDRPVALKVMQPRGMDPQNAARRFVREARLAASLTHPNIVTVYDFGQEEDGTLYVVMELLNGRGLDALLKAEGTVSVARAARIGAQVCDALAVAHERGIIHRDIKPENVIVVDSSPGRDGCKVVDFGLARSLEESGTRITTSGMIFGTAAYISPEMALGKEVGPAADLYALGVMLHELVEGRLPFSAETANGLLLAHATTKPTPMSAHVPASYRNIVSKLLQKKPADRYTSAAEVREALLAVSQAPGADKVVRSAAALAQTASAPRETAATTSGTSLRSTGLADASYVPPSGREAEEAEDLATAGRRSRGGLWWLAAFAVIGAGGGALQQAGLLDGTSAATPQPDGAEAVVSAFDAPRRAAASSPSVPTAVAAPTTAPGAAADAGASPDAQSAPDLAGAAAGADAGSSETLAGAASSDASAQMAEVGPETSAEAGPAQVDFTIRTSVPATVSVDGAPAVATPYRFRGPARQAARRLVFTAVGHETLTLDIPGDEDSAQTVSLVPLPKPTAGPRPTTGWRPVARQLPVTSAPSAATRPAPRLTTSPPPPKPDDTPVFIMPGAGD